MQDGVSLADTRDLDASQIRATHRPACEHNYMSGGGGLSGCSVRSPHRSIYTGGRLSNAVIARTSARGVMRSD